jgi:hypothetical protein
MSARLGSPWRRAAALGVALAAGACRSPAACGPATPPVLLGSWNYVATQTSPTTASLSGVLQISSQCGQQISGTLDVTQTDAGGTRRLAGAVGGTSVGSSSVEFDAYLDAAARQHFATVRNDSLVGTWVEQTGGSPLSGSFTSAWTSTP